ncbi:MAG: hypothetical protein OXH00_02880 [Candidatus Poribacteria bacterium]|nr:hypothetical protein [Candidatus Poribacteria bacterium]
MSAPIAPEYQQFIDERAASYRQIMVLRKLKEAPALEAFIAAMNELNEQLASALVLSVPQSKRGLHIISR